jgi:hypothetical protein
MSKSARNPTTGAMLELWRPPQHAGDPVGCLATTYTFTPGLFDEQCLGRFLEIDSEPDREDLPFLLQRETRLGGVYAGVLVDYTQAGVEHSLRWDVLPVRVRGAKQHAKLTVVAWTHLVRVIVASANLTEPGYRINQEVAASIDLRPSEADHALLAEALSLLRNLLTLVPGADSGLPEIQRAEAFLQQVERLTTGWRAAKRNGTLRHQLVCTLPGRSSQSPARSSLEEVIEGCRRRGKAPSEVRVASPFFDEDGSEYRALAKLFDHMARGVRPELCLCVPASLDADAKAPPRLLAPRSLAETSERYHAGLTLRTLPMLDADRNRRPWHAKLIALFDDSYSALMIGSSNFTSAGMGVGEHRNAEANVLTIADRVQYGREEGALLALWPEMTEVEELESAEWLGSKAADEEEEAGTAAQLPAGFVSATYRAGEDRLITVRLDPGGLPEQWDIRACGQGTCDLLASTGWEERGGPELVELRWAPPQPPERLLVRWDDFEACLPLNVEDARDLPPPDNLARMTADDMLLILAAPDPGAAFRAWVRRERLVDEDDDGVDEAVPIDLDPLRRYDLRATFLHRIRRRARVLADLRANLERPVWSRQALDWRLRGLIGIAPLAERILRELIEGKSPHGEALLTLADLLIVLNEVDYKPSDGSLPKSDFDSSYRSFLSELASGLAALVRGQAGRVSEDVMEFWERVVERCQR